MIEFRGAPNPAREDTKSVADGRGYFAAPQAGTGPGVLLLHAWWGLNETVKRFANRLAGAGFTVLAPDMFEGEVATTIEGAEALAGPRESDEATQIVMEQVVLGAADELARRAGAPIAGVGFSFGAAYAMWLAAKRPEQVTGLVLYYGAYLGVGGEAPVLGHFANDDPWAFEEPQQLDEFEAQMSEAGRPFELHRYAGTKHWFAEPDRPEYDTEAAELAWTRTLEFLHRQLG